MPTLIPLCPPPRVLTETSQALSLTPTCTMVVPERDSVGPVCELLVHAFSRWTHVNLQVSHYQRQGIQNLGRCCLVSEGIRHAEGYRLTIQAEGIQLEAMTLQGLHHGLHTLIQWVQGHGLLAAKKLTELPGVFIEDWPAFANRGMMLDISRSKIPTMDRLFEMVDLAASLKLNQLQLYMEHSFAYAGHETVWRDASPMTGAEIQTLDRYCRARFIQLVPNQNSFGHFHQWLKHPAYRPLAECPEGIEHPFSLDLEPFSLCPSDPRALTLLEDLYDQLLPHFSSDLFNVGLDETFDLGQGRSKELCEQRGKTRVYLDFLNKVHRLIASRGKRMQFWGDIILEKPEALADLPEDVIAMEWGYEANHPFQEHCQLFADSKREYYVCPGTSSWSSIVGRLPNALANLAAAAKAGIAHDASGYLITDWGDYGHFQPPAISMPAWFAGSAYSWNPNAIDTMAEAELKRAIAFYAWQTESTELVTALWELGRVYQDCEVQPTNGSSIFFLLLYADKTMAHARLAGLAPRGLGAAYARAEKAKNLLASIATSTEETQLVCAELSWAANLVQVACDLGSEWSQQEPDQPTKAIPRNKRLVLAERLGRLKDEFLQLRHNRFRPGGAQRSLRYLERVQRLLTMP